MLFRKHVNKAIARAAIVGIIIVILVVAAGAGYYLYTSQKVTISQISLAPTSLTASQGAGITFTVYGKASGAALNISFGDGQYASAASVTHTYANPGTYLVAAQETLNGQVVSSTNNVTRVVQITPVVNDSLAPLISIPTISFNTTIDATAPVVTANAPVILSGGFLEAPTGNSMEIYEYIWNFGNGQTQTVLANRTTYEPVTNPVSVTYTAAGLYPVSLTLVTENTTSGQEYSFTVGQTVAVSTVTQPYTLYEYTGNVPNPSVITEAVNTPGGPYSFDPQVDYEATGLETIQNIMGTLVVYNGSNTSQFIPMLAATIPTVQNGGINANYTAYTFTIRSGMNFSNGYPITAYDVWYSAIRAMLFEGGSPLTPDWILAQYLIPNLTVFVPIMQSANDTADFNAIMNAITYNNATDTVTFHLVTPTAPSLFFTALADPEGSGVLDAGWLQSVGAGITFTPAGFYAYQNEGNEGNYNTQVQYSPVASGPYEIQSYVPGQSIVLKPNPGFPGVPNIPAPTDTIVIEWVKDPETAYNLFTGGQADIVTYLPSTYMPLIKQQVASGTALLYSFPTIGIFWAQFNLNTSISLMKSVFGSNYNIPSDYFANTLVREAFAYAFNYTNYIDELVGNDVYGANFGFNYAGMIPKGMTDYVPPSQLTGIPTYNLSYATQLMKESGEYNISVNIPLVVPSGLPVEYAAMEMWAAALHQMDPNIEASPVYQNFNTIIGYLVPGGNPDPIIDGVGWSPDYPYPSDYVNSMYLQGGSYPVANGWTTAYVNATMGNATATQFQEMNNLILQADSTTNSTLAAQDYKQAEQIGINLYMYVYTLQENNFWIIKPYMSGYHNNIQYQENVMFGGADDSLFYWWVKG